MSSRAVILATGVTYRSLGLAALDRLAGVGVFYGAAGVEAPALTGLPVAVVGGANSAGQTALHLAKYASQVSLLIRGSSLASGMSQYLIDQIQATDNISVRLGTRAGRRRRRGAAGGRGHRGDLLRRANATPAQWSLRLDRGRTAHSVDDRPSARRAGIHPHRQGRGPRLGFHGSPTAAVRDQPSRCLRRRGRAARFRQAGRGCGRRRLGSCRLRPPVPQPGWEVTVPAFHCPGYAADHVPPTPSRARSRRRPTDLRAVSGC